MSSAPRPNWFIGMPVPAATGLIALLDSLPGSIRPFHPQDLHVTLAFLGPVSEPQARLAWSAAAQIDWQPFQVRPLAAGPFGNPAKPSAYGLWVDDADGSLQAFLGRHQQPLRELVGRRPAKRATLPHLTLGRPRPGLDSKERAALKTWCRQFQPPAIELQLDRLALYTWADDRRSRLFQLSAQQHAPRPTKGPDHISD